MCGVFTFVQYIFCSTEHYISFFSHGFQGTLKEIHQFCPSNISHLVLISVAYRQTRVEYIILLPNYKIFDRPKLQAFTEDKYVNVTKTIEICFGKGRKHCGKGEKAGYQHFFLFPQCLQKATFFVSLKVGIVR